MGDERALEVRGRVFGLRERVGEQELVVAGMRLLSESVRPLYQVSPNDVYCRMDAEVPATPLMSFGRRPAPSDGTTGL